jgi:hypothetical protein
MRLKTYLLPGFLASAFALGQNFSFGVIGGAGVTEDFRNQIVSAGSAFSYTTYSTPKRYTGGLMLEFGLPMNLSLEIDGLYRPLGFTFAGIEPNGTLNSVSPATVVTWEFPMLVKYRLPVGAGKLRPFVEAGPSFRTAGNLNGTNPGHYGGTAGVGVETHLLGLNIAPVIRYTYWAPERVSPAGVRTLPNQVELLVGFSHSAESHWHPLGQRVSFGVVAGASLTNDYRSSSHPVTVIYVVPVPGGGYIQQEASGSVLEYSGPKSFLVGPSVEVQMPGNLSLEADAVYRPLRYVENYVVPNGPSFGGPHHGRVLTWEFPVLAKYRFSAPRVKPLIEAGPAFRLPQGLTGGSHVGVTAGVGAEARLHRLKIAPVARFTHWGQSNPAGVTGASLNEVELLVGISL